jgi:hypothetical protein
MESKVSQSLDSACFVDLLLYVLEIDIGVDFTKRGITSRAHLLDIPRHLARNGSPPLDLFTVDTAIPVEMLKSCAESQGVMIAPGDILLIRTGYVETYVSLPDEQLIKLGEKASRQSVGVKVDRPFLEWLWDSGTAAIASDW